MKKLLFTAAAALVMSAAAIGGYTYHQQSQLDPAFLENLEAITQSENSSIGRWRTVGCGSYSMHDWTPYCCPESEWNNCPSKGNCNQTVYGC